MKKLLTLFAVPVISLIYLFQFVLPVTRNWQRVGSLLSQPLQ